MRFIAAPLVISTNQTNRLLALTRNLRPAYNSFTMAKTAKQLDELLEHVRGEDLPTLQELDGKLHLLMAQKRSDISLPNKTNQSIATECLGVKIEPELAALVGIHPETPIEEDKNLIRAAIGRRLAD